MTDFRLTWGFLDHPKIVKLQRNLGSEAVLNLIRLYEFTSRQRPKGILHNMDHEDIECAAKWNGDPGVFVQWLLDIRLLDCNGEWCEIHDWEEHNPWAYHSDSRKLKARHAARMRWACSEHTNSNAPSPIPSPTPFLKNNASKDEAYRLPIQDEIENFSEPKLKEELDKICSELRRTKIWTEGFAMMNKMRKKCKNDRTILYALKGVYLYKPKEPWPYVQKIISVEDGNFNEREYHRFSPRA